MTRLLAAIFLLNSCSPPQNKSTPATAVQLDSTTTIATPTLIDSVTATKPNLSHALEKSSTTGDFNGDGKQDTLYQHNISQLANAEIDSIPAFEGEDGYFKLQDWLKKQQSDVCLTMPQPSADTIHLGAGIGLYCLLNLGDLNKDGKDEVALVVDYADVSNINTCSIYSFCNEKWRKLGAFSIDEDSFVWTADAKPAFVHIKDYLEKRNGTWYYMDHQKMMVGEQPEDSEMRPLTVENCN